MCAAVTERVVLEIGGYARMRGCNAVRYGLASEEVPEEHEKAGASGVEVLE